VTLDANGSFTYRPRANFAGTDSFTYRAIDTNGEISVAKVTMVVAAVNDAPVAIAAQLSTQEDVALPINLAAYLSDVDGDAVTPVIVSAPCHGTLVRQADGSYLYVPEKNFYGTDSFTIRGSDGKLWSNVAQIQIKVTPVNDAPTAVNASAEVRRDGSIRIDFGGLVDDADGDCLSITVGKAGHGTLVRDCDGIYIYRPTPGYVGPDSFTYAVSDGKVTTSARIDIKVLAPSTQYRSGSASIVLGSKLVVAAPLASDQFMVINLASEAGKRYDTVAPLIDWNSSVQVASGPRRDDESWLADFLGGDSQTGALGANQWSVKLPGG
jgi:hypothetical protein